MLLFDTYTATRGFFSFSVKRTSFNRSQSSNRRTRFIDKCRTQHNEKMKCSPPNDNGCLGQHTTMFLFHRCNTVHYCLKKSCSTPIQLKRNSAKCHPSFNETIQSYFSLHKGLIERVIGKQNKLPGVCACSDKYGHFAIKIVAHVFLNLGG